MSAGGELYYICVPRGERPVGLAVEWLPVQEFTADEPACKDLWRMVNDNFRTRGKFLAVWPCVRHVAVHRDGEGVAGLLLVSEPVNWQIDYVVVEERARGRGVARALVAAALNEAARRGVPYVMLSSREDLRELYSSCGFTPVAGPAGPLPVG